MYELHALLFAATIRMYVAHETQRGGVGLGRNVTSLGGRNAGRAAAPLTHSSALRTPQISNRDTGIRNPSTPIRISKFHIFNRDTLGLFYGAFWARSRAA